MDKNIKKVSKKRMALIILGTIIIAMGAFGAEARGPRTYQPSFGKASIYDWSTGSEYSYMDNAEIIAYLRIENDLGFDLDKINVRVLFYDLDFSKTYRNIILDDNDRVNINMPVYLPAGTEPGYYPVRITIFDNYGNVHRVKNRELFLR